MSFMTDRIFADTNLFVYAQSNDEYKSSRATSYIENSPVISTQVVNETVSVLIKKYKYTLSEAHEIAESLLELCEIVPVDETTIRQAILLAKTYSLSHWDSLIVSSALLAGCNVLLSEDMQHGQVFNNQLKVVNPFI
jgi:predicted nucleic acid-binding protein